MMMMKMMMTFKQKMVMLSMKNRVIVTIIKKKVTKIMKTNLQIMVNSKKNIDSVLPNIETHANGNDNHKVFDDKPVGTKAQVFHIWITSFERQWASSIPNLNNTPDFTILEISRNKAFTMGHICARGFFGLKY